LVDDLTIAEIIGIGAAIGELTEAANWVVNDEALMNIGKLIMCSIRKSAWWGSCR
jgi:hypothetical protein